MNIEKAKDLINNAIDCLAKDWTHACRNSLDAALAALDEKPSYLNIQKATGLITSVLSYVTDEIAKSELTQALAALDEKPTCKTCNGTKIIQVSTENGSPFRDEKIECPFCNLEKPVEQSEFTKNQRHICEVAGCVPSGDMLEACDIIDRQSDEIKRLKTQIIQNNMAGSELKIEKERK